MKDHSKNITQGIDRAPQRSLLNALGLTAEEMNRPVIGIVNGYNEVVPGHTNLDKITQAVKMGVAMAGVHHLNSRQSLYVTVLPWVTSE